MSARHSTPLPARTIAEAIPEDRIWRAPAPPGADPPQPANLAWHPSVKLVRPQPAAANGGMSPFVRRLARAQIVDTHIDAAPGGFVVLPWGVRVLARFRTLIADLAAELSYEEFEFPMIAPRSLYAPIADLVDLDANLVRVRLGPRDSDHVLSPTGEQSIYSYWARRLRHPHDFPVRLFQRARYFRPGSAHRLSGGGVYKSVEAGDVYEFHSAHCDAGEADRESVKLARLFARAAVLLGVDMLWGTRPPWSNNGHLYEYAVGGDALIPGVTVQVAASYFQGQTFSARYGVGVHRGGRIDPAWQADGAISRRIVFAACHQAFDQSRPGWSLPAALAPVHLIVLGSAEAGSSMASLPALVEAWRGRGHRVEVDLVPSPILAERRRLWEDRGVPLQLLLFDGKQGPSAVLRRFADGLECRPEPSRMDANLVQLALDDIGRDAARTRRSRRDARIVAVESADEVREIVAGGGIADCPMLATRTNMERVASMGCGELLSYERVESPAPCIFEKTPTRIRGRISRRL